MLLLGALTVTVLAQGDTGRIERFERQNPVATATVDAGTALEDAGLPETLRAVVPLTDEERSEAGFEQDQPSMSSSDGSYDFYDYGYVPPADVESRYAAGELAVYTITYAGDDGSVAETAYRVYGSLDGGEPTWFSCDENGNLTGRVLDVPVTWEGTFDPDEPGEYTLTASFTGYTYADARPYAVVTVEVGEASDDAHEHSSDDAASEEDDDAPDCTCDVGNNEYSSEHAEDCPYYAAESSTSCTCELGSDEAGPGHAEDCPLYTALAEGCTCGPDGEAIDADNFPWAHDADCPWYSPAECTCRELIEVTEEADEDGETYLETTYHWGGYTHEHDPENTSCALYGQDTVEVVKANAGALSSQLLDGTDSVMALDDAEEIVSYQEEHADDGSPAILYGSLGEISVVEGSEQAASTAAATLSWGDDGSNAESIEDFITENTPTSGNDSFDSDFADVVIPGEWIDYINTMWMYKVMSDGDDGFSWSAASDAYSGWAWSGAAASSNSGSVTTSATRIPTKSGAVWTVYSGEQLRYALENFDSGDTIRLGGNINMNGQQVTWEPLSIAGKGLTIDGQGYTIYNLSVYQTSEAVCVFLYGTNKGFTVKDLEFSSAAFVQAATTTGHCSLFSNTNGLVNDTATYYVTLTNVSVTDSMFYSRGSMVSPFGRLSQGTTDTSTHFYRSVPRVSNCYVTGSFLYGVDHVSGFCLGAGPVQFASAYYNESYWGTFKNCYSLDNMIFSTGGHSAGFTSCNGEGAFIDGCFAANEQYGSASVSGFLGGLMAEVTDCYSSGKIEGYAVLGGFAFTYTQTFYDDNPRVFTNCYSTALVGLRSDPTHQGGFMATMNQSSSNHRSSIMTNCYAAGEVGNIDLDMDEPDDVGGFVDTATYQADSYFTYNTCYYDKQTTAMREWVAGDVELESLTDSWRGVTGVLTTDTANGLSGLTGQPGSSGFTGFTDDSKWVYADGRYPQLAVFASADAGIWGSQEAADLVRAWSLASTATVMLDTWDTGYTWDDDGVRSETEVSWDGEGSGASNVGGQLTYDTVRDIVSDFAVTQNTTWSTLVGGGAPAEVEGADGEVQTVTETVSIDSAASTGAAENPGMDWFGTASTSGSATADRPLRLIAYMAVEAGDNADVHPGDDYDHRDDVSLTMVDELIDDRVIGLDDDEVWSRATKQLWPTSQTGGETVQESGFYGVDTVPTRHSASQGAILNTEIWVAEIDSTTGDIVSYPAAGADGDYYYDEGRGAYLKADTAVHVTGQGSEGSLDQQKWRGEVPLYPDTSTGRAYIISYYWIMEDGRYATDHKVVTIVPGDYSVDIRAQNLDGTANSDLLALDVAADDSNGGTAYDVSGSTTDHAQLDYNDDTGGNTVRYTTNVTAAWKKAGEDVQVQGIKIELFRRDDTLAGTAEVTGPVVDGTEVTIPTVLYYYLDGVQVNGADRETTKTQTVNITYTVVEVKDGNGEGTGEYYLRFNKLVNTPADEWAGAAGGTNDDTGVAVAASDTSDLSSVEAYINDVQFDTQVTLTVTGGAIGGLAWVDADGDGVRETGSGCDDEFVDASSSTSGHATVGGEEVPESAEDLFDIDGLVATLMRADGGGWAEVTDTDGDHVQVELSSAGGGESTFTLDADGTAYTVTARSEGGWGYYFGGLPADTYAVRFSTGEFALGAYEASPQNEGDDDTLDSDASGRYVTSEGGSESATPGSSGWLSSTIVETITIPESTGEGHEAYLSLNNDTGLVPRLGSITIDKSDEDGNSLEGVTFTLELLMSGDDWDNSNAVVTVAEDQATDNDGTLSFEDLWPGTYRLTETGSAGESLLAEPVIIEVPFTSDAEGDASPSYVFGGTNHWLDLGYDVVDGSVFALPMAGGGLPWWAWLLVGAAVVVSGLVIGAGAYRYRRGRRIAKLRRSLGT